MNTNQFNDEPTQIELEDFFVNNELLEKISEGLNRFNPIKTMKMERQEIKHSAILSWLLDPNETHGLGDRFLKGFIAEALRGKAMIPNALEVFESDLRDVEIRTEWQNIDILALSFSNRWAFVIENKFDSKQHGGQLSKYTDRVRAAYEEFRVRGIFLTLFEEEPQDANYATIGYRVVLSILEKTIAQQTRPLSDEVRIFIGHYIDLLKDATGMNENTNELQKLARQLYIKHKKAWSSLSSTDQALASSRRPD